MSSPIASFSGLASGIQWGDLIDQIIQAESSQRLGPVQTRIQRAQKEKSDWQKFQGLVSAYDAAAEKLKDGSAFGALQTTVPPSPTSSRQLLTVSTSDGAQAGTYRVEVKALASAQKLRSGLATDGSTALNLSGDFWVNGQKVSVATTDTLSDVRDRLNAVSAASGVTATLLSGSATSSYLVLGADQAGERGIELADGDSGVLHGLGILGAGTSANTDPVGGQAQSQRFADTTTSIASILGVTSPPPTTTIDVGGTKVQVDLANDTLVDLMNRINTQVGANTASLATETVNGRTTTRLQVSTAVSADAAAASPADSQRALELLGFQTAAPANAISAGGDAEVVVDGLRVRQRDNAIDGVVSGVTFQLTAAEPGTTIDVQLARDDDAAKTAVKALADAYNQLVDFASNERSGKGPLAASGTLRALVSRLKEPLVSDMTGVSATNPYDRAGAVGVMLDRYGKLQVDDAKLDAPLARSFADVAELFGASGLGGAITGETDRMLDTVDGDFVQQTESLDSSVSSLQKRQDDIQGALDREREALVAQYTRMEQAISRVQAQGSWLSSQVGSLPSWGQ